jgi:hypothetical protein
MITTLENVKELLSNDNLIQLSFIYSYSSRKYWRLTQPISIRLSNGQEIEIPAGFKTDLSSVPKCLWSIAPPFGDFLLAAIIHDYLYTNNIGTRKAADEEMMIWSERINSNHLDNIIRYYAVRAFGQSWWNRHTNQNKKIVNSDEKDIKAA